ncbi:GNAT family N-acetyltransferase [Marinicella sediminis]|uniref:GNAT family N-acetyltransferase n=1 Tax=Marinicella sediminis TaxID=1792834 RepID=A0ABV7J8U8_9GAMM|nr:GNAT family N-acetyltransferase [Marinicella sediminis]
MSDVVIRPAIASDLSLILSLNDAEVRWTSPLNHQQLVYLDQQACYHRVICEEPDVPVGFLLVLPAGADYASDNYRWFSTQLTDFWYIDRIVINSNQAGKGLGVQLYQDLCQAAQHEGIVQLACEYNLHPPNRPSARFHQRFGFEEMAQQTHNGKMVSLQVLDLNSR